MKPLEINDARDARDDRRLEAMADVVRLGAAPGHFVQADVKPVATFLAAHINRQRPGRGRQLNAPLRQRVFAPDPDFSRITFSERIPHQAETYAKDRAIAMDDKVRRKRLTTERGADGLEIITVTDDMRRGNRSGRVFRHLT